jgi:hypothetical protein
MGNDVLERFREFAVPYRSPLSHAPGNLTVAEQQAFDRCLGDSLRLEQERLSGEFVNAGLSR